MPLILWKPGIVAKLSLIGINSFKKSNLKNGLVIKSTGSWYVIKADTGEKYDCIIKGNLRIKGFDTTNPIAVGDRVVFDLPQNEKTQQQNKTGMIYSVNERKNYIIRRSQNLSKQAHIIAANIDLAVLIITINYPVTTTTFMDRYLASAEAYRIPSVLVFNKIDLYDATQMSLLNELMNIYTAVGYPCLQTSAVNDSGLNELKNFLRGKISVFNGHSGVGKSTLINKLQPGFNLKTQQISDYHEKGKHTTTFSELFELDFGGYIIDTPGIKAYGMLEMESWEISHYFKEIFKMSEFCQYNNCSHTHEPGCAVKVAVEKGEIASSRFISYLGLLEKDEKYRPAW
jgi:ribosome biogenesis GTPase / thiamine phosphate phosphatase